MDINCHIELFLLKHRHAFVFSAKKENPLALLGQYRDDEEDEEAADQPTGETKGSPRDANAKVIHFLNMYCPVIFFHEAESRSTK